MSSPAASRLCAKRDDLVACGPDGVAAEGEVAAAYAHASEEEAMAGQRRVERRARSVSAANWLLPAAMPTPAHTAAMSLKWLHSRSSSSRIVLAQESGSWREAERLLARVRVGDRSSPRRRRRRVARRALRRASALRRALEASVLVEESRVEVEDAVAYDVEAKWATRSHPRGSARPRSGTGRAAHGPSSA